MTYIIAVFTVKNSWWWTEKLSETCRVSFQNKFEKLLLLVGFIIRKLSWCTVTWTSRCTVIWTSKAPTFRSDLAAIRLPSADKLRTGTRAIGSKFNGIVRDDYQCVKLFLVMHLREDTKGKSYSGHCRSNFLRLLCFF
jgi:hypothetical protein